MAAFFLFGMQVTVVIYIGLNDNGFAGRDLNATGFESLDFAWIIGVEADGSYG